MRAGNQNNPADLNLLDTEVLLRFEQDRARMLRRRLAWYSVVMLGLLALSLFIGVGELMGPALEPGQEHLRAGTMVEVAGDVALAVLYSASLVYALGWRAGRDRLVRVITWLTITASAILIVVAPMAQLLNSLGPDAGVDAASEGSAALSSGMMGLLSLMALHTLACLLIRLTPREAWRIFVPIGVVFIGAVVVLYIGNATVKGVLIAMLPLAAAPGMGWTWWRFKRYREVSRTEILHGRYTELAHELASARQIHEALFPPPIERGRYRMGYEYEPKREIGGDFLFVHPLAFPPSAVETPLSVVVIDVTGHGVSAALAVNRLHGELRRVYAQDPDAGAGAVIELLNAYAYEHLAPQSIYATAICLRLDGEGLAWSSAGHPPALVRRKAGAPGGETERLKATATMLGVLEPGLFAAGEQRTALGANDLVVALTDGAIEARDREGRCLEIEGVERVLRDGAFGAGRSASVAVMEAVLAHRAGGAVDDTLVVEVGRA